MNHTDRNPGSRWPRPWGRFAAVAVAVGGLAIVALAPGTAGAASPTTASEISTAKNSEVGTYLVAENAVYTLKPSKTACDAKCLKVWPAVVLPQGVTTATAGTGVDAAKLGTTTAANGALQVTYGGKPLYWFAKDKGPGQVRGNVTDKWGKWAAVVTVKSKSGSDSGDKNAGTGGVSF